ncbi:glycosyltransferase family 4 protein [Sphingomonas alpina]|uniref:Glycosyltransferase family 4 protein n=1 Tax=Sphingomonas alpina TaxID=653931 RepID=A0A7H0LDC2_9SPHN|nr:glycosyltransferase family 4 protein [Sphingomonas alpina]QNQ07675.1 glycosyltransferase family 4 protein [Sphingomonas alpina]
MPGRNPRRPGQGGDRACDILIAIAGRQHADQLTTAMVESGWNATLHHASPIRPALVETLTGHHQLHPLTGLIFRAGNKLLPLPLAYRLAHHMYAQFDRNVARALPKIAPRAVIAYENGALDTLKAAKRLGLPTILDAASVHHSMQAEGGLNDIGTAFRNRVNARKDAEIALADHILCCSTLAANSYIAAGVPEDRVHAVPLGFEPGSFGPGLDQMPHEGPLRLAFVGRFTGVKGADLLATALETLVEQGIPYDCRVAAARTDGMPDLVARLGARATLLGKVPHDELATLYRWADLLVMPSRFDSFGLVVPEALACGLPVLASDHVGASDFIVPGENGAIIPFNDADALTQALAKYAADPAGIRAMRPAALASAQGAEWAHYRTRVARIVTNMLGWSAPS